MLDAELAVSTTLADVARVTQQVRTMLPDWLAESEADAIEIALCEALTNVVKHGYGGDAKDAMRLRLQERSGALVVEILDRGHSIPGDRLDNADATVFDFDATDLAGLPEGGMGLALIKSAFHEVRYRSRDGFNRLQMVRRM